MNPTLGREKPTPRISSSVSVITRSGVGRPSGGNSSQKRLKMVAAALVDNCCEAIDMVSASNGSRGATLCSLQAPTRLITAASFGPAFVK